MKNHPALLWTGRVLSALPAAMLLFSAGLKISSPAWMVEEWQKNGFPPGTLVPIGVIELLCTVLYLVPQTAVLGAILLTGYMGGAIATHVRLGDAWYFQFAFGVVVWLGLYLREPRLRALLPLRQVGV